MALPVLQQISKNVSSGPIDDRFTYTVPVHRDGIGEVEGRSRQINLIHLESGETVGDVQPPSATDYLADGSLPLIGFLVPWGAIRILAWLIAGFQKRWGVFCQLYSCPL